MSHTGMTDNNGGLRSKSCAGLDTLCDAIAGLKVHERTIPEVCSSSPQKYKLVDTFLVLEGLFPQAETRRVA